MPSLWFCVPVYGRLPLARICLTQLRRTCDQLAEHGVDASAVIVADRHDLDELPDLGFATVVRDNRFVSRKFNDGIQLACDPEFNPRPVDYVVPCGSDDWVDWRLFTDLPVGGEIVAFQHMSFVREDGRELVRSKVAYRGGCGIRIYPRQLFAPLGYRPADEDRERGCDTSILTNLTIAHHHLEIDHRVTDPHQIVDWKTAGTQLNSYHEVSFRFRGETGDPYTDLADVFDLEALEEMEAHYGLVAAAA